MIKLSDKCDMTVQLLLVEKEKEKQHTNQFLSTKYLGEARKMCSESQDQTKHFYQFDTFSHLPIHRSAQLGEKCLSFATKFYSSSDCFIGTYRLVRCRLSSMYHVIRDTIRYIYK